MQTSLAIRPVLKELVRESQPAVNLFADSRELLAETEAMPPATEMAQMQRAEAEVALKPEDLREAQDQPRMAVPEEAEEVMLVMLPDWEAEEAEGTELREMEDLQPELPRERMAEPTRQVTEGRAFLQMRAEAVAAAHTVRQPLPL